jgi:hypothetical protein
MVEGSPGVFYSEAGQSGPHVGDLDYGCRYHNDSGNGPEPRPDTVAISERG